MDDAPDWVRDSFDQFVHELGLFFATAFAFTTSPARFAADWASGKRRALNPLGFLATAFAIIGVADLVFAHVEHLTDAPDFVESLLGAALPFVYYLVLGILAHLVLRLFGSGQPLRSSCAMALYAGGGPMLLAHALTLTASVILSRLNGRLEHHVSTQTPHAWLVLVSILGGFLFFLVTFAASLAGLHARRVRAWQAVVALVVAVVLAGVAFDVIKPPGEYGVHPVFGLHYDAHSWNVHFGLSTG